MLLRVEKASRGATFFAGCQGCVRWQTQDMGYSRERVFVTPPAVGAGATTRFLVVADLGHAQLDGSEEVNFNHVRDNVTYNKNQSLQQARPRALVCRGVCIPP